MCHFRKEVREHLELEITPGPSDFPAARWLGLPLPVQGMRLQTLLRALRSHMLHGPKSQNPEQKCYCHTFIKTGKRKKELGIQAGWKMLLHHLLRATGLWCQGRWDWTSVIS